MEKNFLSHASRLKLLETDIPTLDTDWLCAQPHLPFLVQALPAHTLYTLLQKNDLQDSLELIEWMRGPQLQKVLDFDIWHYSPELNTDDISQNAALSWIQAWLLIGHDFAAERFFELDDETAFLMLTKFFVILPEGITHITDDVRENWTATPDKRFFIKPTSEDNTEFEILTEFIKALYHSDIKAAGEMFGAASMLVRQETLEFAQKWRSARLADQGFIPSEEAYRSLFSNQIHPKPIDKTKVSALSHDFFEEDASVQIQGLLSKLDPEDGLHLLKQALSSESLRQITGSENSSIDHLYDDEEFIEDSACVIAKQAQNILYAFQKNSHNGQKNTLLVEAVLQHFYEKDPELFIIVKQKIAYITNTMSSVLATYQAYQPALVHTAMRLVRGALNIGFEICLDGTFGIESVSKEISSHILDASARVIKEIGIDTLFKIGFNSIIDLQKTLLNSLVEQNYISVKTRVAARSWISSPNYPYSTESNLALEGLLRTIPMVHQDVFVLESFSKKLPTHLSQKYKPFESREEIKQVETFIKNLKLNLK